MAGDAGAAGASVGSVNGRSPLGAVGAAACCALLATAFLLGLGVLSSNVGTAYASSSPTVRKVQPNAGPGTGGTTVNISGTNFTGATAVKFGSNNATSFTVKSAISIAAKSPAGSGVVDVTVATPGGISSTGSADQFAYLPVVTAVSPISGPVDGGTTVNITGVDFTGAVAVAFGSTAASSFTVNSATSITAVSPAGAVAGNVHVRVTTPEGTSPASPNDTFKYTPTVTSVSPSTGPPAGGTAVTVKGTGFAVGETATQIKFGPRRAASVNCTTTTECVAETPELLPGEYKATVDVLATVNTVASPRTTADQFHYHGLYLLIGRKRLGVGTEVTLRMSLGANEFNACNAFLGARIAANGETTDEIAVKEAHYGSCLPYEWSGVLPDAFTLRVNSDGTASIEGVMGVGRGAGGCVYEGEKMSGGFQPDALLSVGLGGQFGLVAEEEPGEECSETESVSMYVDGDESIEAELVG
ncbi:MAG: hypothetical protein JWN81_2055 [Solirubrobacterales bacterium]|nr:hypothetical protein [Solirubrobacterales bacterium]